jgi:hypothetical protein
MTLNYYSSESTWKELTKLLPFNNRIDDNFTPTEYYWKWTASFLECQAL